MGFFNRSQLGNLREVFSNKRYLMLGIISSSTIGYLFYYFTNLDIMVGNLGLAHAIVNSALQMLITIMFGISLPLALYKLNFARSIKAKTGSVFLENKGGGAGVLGGVMSVLIAGCPACGITLASILGFGAVFSVLPFYGLELKAVGLGLLLYSNYSLLNNLKTCDNGIKIKRK